VRPINNIKGKQYKRSKVRVKSSNLATKLETLEETQALEKYHLDVVNKQWGAKLENIEGLLKTFMFQAQEKPSSSFVQNIGMGNRIGNQGEVPGRAFRSFSNGTDFICLMWRKWTFPE
jgi:hypothetical protein